MYKLLFLSFILFYLSPVQSKIPDFLDRNDIINAKFDCFGESPVYSESEQKHIDLLWSETLFFLSNYAQALTNAEGSHCLYSDEAIYDTTQGGQKICVMDREDMKKLVKNIYQVLNNQDKAKTCFGARKDVDWLYTPGGKLQQQSPVAQWLNRMTFDDFFDTKVTNKEVKQQGKVFAKNFSNMVTGDEIKMPSAFPNDISAKTLPNLWAAVGWFPMYAEESQRNNKNFINIRGGYAYAEVLGHWGLLRIDKINGEKVGAEIGMTVQSVNTLYSYHHHATSEIYYNIRIPACINQFKSFAIREDSPLLKIVVEDGKTRKVQFDASQANDDSLWLAGSSLQDSLIYLHQNTIHAFDVDGSCEDNPEEKAIVSIWARSDAHDTRNDYGTTMLCESAQQPGTPAKRGEVVECDLTKVKW